MTMAMGPYLLIGFFTAGLLSICVSDRFVERHLGGRGLRAILRASLIGVPVPLCSCSVIPVAVSIRKQGASRGATVAFLTATPQDGVDSIMATYGMLGPLFTVARVVTALLSGVFSGAMIEWLAPNGGAGTDSNGTASSPSCCAAKAAGVEAPAVVQKRPGRFRRFLRHGFVVLPRDIGKALLVGLLLSGVLTTFLPDQFFSDVLPGGGWWTLPAMLVVALPMYACSTGSIPLVVALIGAGLSPGAGLVYLIAGPATNTATMAAMSRMFGTRALGIYLVSLSAFALAAGYLINFFWVALPASATAHGGHLLPAWIHLPAGVLLLALLAPSLLRWRKRKGA